MQFWKLHFYPQVSYVQKHVHEIDHPEHACLLEDGTCELFHTLSSVFKTLIQKCNFQNWNPLEISTFEYLQCSFLQSHFSLFWHVFKICLLPNDLQLQCVRTSVSIRSIHKGFLSLPSIFGALDK